MDSFLNPNGMAKMNGKGVMGACFAGLATTASHLSAACYRALRECQDVGSFDGNKWRLL